MLVFIDESGDCGRKFDRGSSEKFVVAAAIFQSPQSADACDRGIEEIRRTHRLSSNFEFHFTHCSDRVREAFFRGVANEYFVYYAFVLNKRSFYSNRHQSAEKFYNFAVNLVCQNARSHLTDAKVVIDKCGDRQFKSRLEKRLKEQMTDDDGFCRIRKVSMEGSHTNNLVQLADMLCGAITRWHHSDNHKDRKYREWIKGREERVQYWPP